MKNNLKNNNFLIKDKRGSLSDPIFGGAYVLKIAVTILICFFIWLKFKDIMTLVVAGSHGEATILDVMTQITSSYISIDYMFPFLVLGLVLVSTIFAFKTGANLIYVFFSIIFWFIALLMAAVFVNVYITSSDAFPTIYTQFPVTDFIMCNLHWITLFWLALITAVMFRKNNYEDDASSSIQRRFIK